MVKTLLDINLQHHQTNPFETSKLSQKSLTSDRLNSLIPHSPDLKLKVLIVDDNLLNLRVMKQLLKKKLAQFLDLEALQTAPSGLEALDLLSNHQFHLVLLDISMPGISGLEVCRRLRQSAQFPSQIHICAVTTDLAEWQIQHYRSFGMDGVIGKPLKDSDLQFALEACLQSPIADHTYDHMCHQSNPRFYFRRHGAHQPLPPLLPIQPDSSDFLDQSDSWDSLSSVTSTAPPSCPICQTEFRSILTFPDSYSERKFRQQSIVSDSSVSAILTYGESDRLLQMARPGLEQLNLTSDSLTRERRPSFESFATSTPGSMTTCSSGPSSAIANDLLSPSYPPASIDMPHSTGCQPLAFLTAPIITSTDVRSLPRIPSQRRWDSFSCSFAANPRAFRFRKQENDVFADGFRAAMNETRNVYGCLGEEDQRVGRSSRCRSSSYENYFSRQHSSYNRSSSTPESQKLTTGLLSSSMQSQDSKTSDERWTQLAEPVQVTQSKAIAAVSAVTRQLITRRSHPVLPRNRSDAEESPLNNSRETVSIDEAPAMRKALSASGLPSRPSWQLVQLSALNYQSVLKSGGLLDEVLIGLDLEDHHV